MDLPRAFAPANDLRSVLRLTRARHTAERADALQGGGKRPNVECDVLPFVRGSDTGDLIVEPGQEAPSEHAAMSRARAMIGRKAGAIAFRRTGDPALGGFEDAVTLGRHGETPDDLASFTSVE